VQRVKGQKPRTLQTKPQDPQKIDSAEAIWSTHRNPKKGPKLQEIGFEWGNNPRTNGVLKNIKSCQEMENNPHSDLHP